MGIRSRIAAVGVAGLVGIAPIALWQQPAGAATNSASNDVQAPFVDANNQASFCAVSLAAVHDTTAETLSVSLGLGYSSGVISDCFDDAYSDVVIDYHDAAGKAQRTESQATGTILVRLSGVVSNVKATVTVTYGACSLPKNGSCSFTTSVAPK